MFNPYQNVLWNAGQQQGNNQAPQQTEVPQAPTANPSQNPLANNDYGRLALMYAQMQERLGQQRDTAHKYNTAINQVHHGPASLPSNYMTTPKAGPWDIVSGQIAGENLRRALEEGRREPVGSPRSGPTGHDRTPYSLTKSDMTQLQNVIFGRPSNFQNAKNYDRRAWLAGQYKNTGNEVFNPVFWDGVQKAWAEGTLEQFLSSEATAGINPRVKNVLMNNYRIQTAKRYPNQQQF